MNIGYMQTQVRQAYGSGSGSHENGGMDGKQFYRKMLLPALHTAGRCLTTKSDGKAPFLTQQLPDNISIVLEGGVAGYFRVDPNPGIELHEPYDSVTSSVFRGLRREAKRNGLKLEYKPTTHTDVFKDLRKLANGESSYT